MAYAELILKPDLGRRPYRLRSRFVMPALTPQVDRDLVAKTTWNRLFEQLAVKNMESFVAQMALQGWQYRDNICPVPHHPHPDVGKCRALYVTGPYPETKTSGNIIVRPSFDARRDTQRVLNGERFLDEDDGYVSVVQPLQESEYWEFEESGIFIHETILVERPAPHEEIEVINR